MDNPLPAKDSAYFKELQLNTGWNRTLYGFATWCNPDPGWQTLDIGCGPGLLPAILSRFGCKAIGVDLDFEMYQPLPLHPIVAVADVHELPFLPNTFNLITCSNLLFMLEDPLLALRLIKTLIVPGGKFAMLNPSEHLNGQAAAEFADKNGLEGIARETLLNWARRAAENHHWTEEETIQLYRNAGLSYTGSELKVGPGFGRFSSASG